MKNLVLTVGWMQLVGGTGLLIFWVLDSAASGFPATHLLAQMAAIGASITLGLVAIAVGYGMDVFEQGKSERR